MPSISQWIRQPRLPKNCSLCNHYYQGQHAICSPCQTLFVPIPFACTTCARPLPEGDFLTCGLCIQNRPYFDNTIAPYVFEEPLRTLLHEFKYHQGLYLTSFLAHLILKSLKFEQFDTDCLIPVPMHPRRLQQRGFNQAVELTKYLSKVLNIPFLLNACKKIRPTPSQAGLNATQRQYNLRDVFEIRPLHYKHVTLIDDLLTTGSTANELAKALKNHGVQHVSVWCCARAIEFK